jgi:hypothetical protein
MNLANCGKIMDHINLVLKFRMAGDGVLQTKGVVRIKLDGRGGLIFYEVHGGETQRIALGQLDCLSVLSMPPAMPSTAQWQTAVIN